MKLLLAHGRRPDQLGVPEIGNYSGDIYLLEILANKAWEIGPVVRIHMPLGVSFRALTRNPGLKKTCNKDIHYL